MRRIPYYIVDVFTDVPLGGNPLAVFPDTANLREQEFQPIAAEMNLSETVFVQEPTQEGALRRLRIFTPRAELPLAGHPVIGTWYLLASRQMVDFDQAEQEKLAYTVRHDNLPDKVIFRHELKVGVLTVTLLRDGDMLSGVVMDQDSPVYGDEITDVAAAAAAVGLDKSAITGSFSLPRVVSTGLPVLIVPLGTRNALTAAKVNVKAYDELASRFEFNGIYAYTRDATVDTETAFVSARGFFPELGIIEDPATGSAAGALGAYLAKNKLVGDKKTVAFQVEQGTDMGRPGRIGVELTLVDGEVERVRVGGTAVVVAEAHLLLP